MNEAYVVGIMPLMPHGTNSTMFTECCRTAICDDQKKCPLCGRDVIGHDASNDYKRGRIRWNDATRGWNRASSLYTKK